MMISQILRIHQKYKYLYVLTTKYFFFSSTTKIHSLYIRAIIRQKAVSWRRNIKSHSPRAAVALGNGHMFTEDSVHYENNV